MVSKGDTLHGNIADLTAKGVIFEPSYGKGSIAVKWADVQSLESDDTFTVLHGEDGETRGRLLGLEGGKWLLVGDTHQTAERVDIDALFRAFDDTAASGSLLERFRSRLRFWAAALDAGAAYTDSSTDKVLGFADLLIERRRARTHLLFEGGVRYANEKEQGEKRSITENVIFGLVRGEYDLTDRIYSYASTRATHDSEQHLSLRLEPRGGLGVHIFKSEELRFSTDVGAALIYEDYFGDEFIDPPSLAERSRGNDNFWAIAFGAQADAKLPYGALWRARAEYLPAVDDWMDDYLARAETSLDYPVVEWLAFKVAIADEYDNTPAPGAQRNKVVTTAGLSLRFP